MRRITMKGNSIRFVGSVTNIVLIAILTIVMASCSSTSTTIPVSSTPVVSPALSSTATAASSTPAVSTTRSSTSTAASSTPAASTLPYSLSISPAAMNNMAVGSTQQFTVTATYSDGSTADVTSQVAWTNSDKSVASIDPSGLATGITPGTTKLNAFLSGLTSSTVTLTVD